jgi:hypothetical protein
MNAQPRRDIDDSTRGLAADLTATFAGVLLLIASCFDIIQGVSAVADDDLFAQGSEYLYKFNVTAWGWIHIVIGVLGVAVAIGVLRRASWGQVTGLMVAGLSILTNFAFLPVYPLWAAFVIGFDALVIWALCVQLKNYQ